MNAKHLFPALAAAFAALAALCADAFAAPLASAARRLPSSPADTVEIYALKVEFAFEDPDNSLTTGRGVFDSDQDTARGDYSLDPQGARRTSAYWEKQFQMVSHWFRTVSRGKLEVRAKIFPEGGSAYSVGKEMIEYNRTTRRSDEKTAQFDSARTVDYLRFVRDAVRAAAKAKNSPFDEPLPSGGRTHRLFMVVHAGASRLIDGGSLGTQYADTPGDFSDAWIDRGSFLWLRDDEEAAGDSLGVVLEGKAVDTVSNVLVVSETASQDGVNWGIKGEIVHQIARAVGLPMTYDATKGISRVGWFDMLDFAGYNAANGFLPVFPNAWARATLGWDEAVTARPGPDGTATYSLRAVSDTTPGGIRVLKIPLTAGEYLLVENRQRTADPKGRVVVETDRSGARTVPADSLDRIFLDSLCDAYGRSCEKNGSKSRGVLLSASSYDAGLPASGLVVWKVNDWYVDRVLRYGYVNATQEGTLSDRYLGVQMLEADGVLSIGRKFTDAYGQPAYDYGSGADLLPHVSWNARKGKRDTVLAITPYGYAGTGSSNNGKTHIVVSASIPDGARKEKALDAFSGDSVATFAAPEIEVTVDWRETVPKAGIFPVEVAPNSVPSALATLPNPDGSGEAAVVALGDRGHAQLFDARGNALAAAVDTIRVKAGYDSVSMLVDDPALGDSAAFPVRALGSASGEALALAASGDRVFTLRREKGKTLLRFTEIRPLPLAAGDSLWRSVERSVPGATSGPMVLDGAVWVASPDSLWKFASDGTPAGSWAWPAGFRAHEIAGALHFGERGRPAAVAVGSSGKVAAAAGGEAPEIAADLFSGDRSASDEAAGQAWRIVVSDFDGDGLDDAFLLGSHGSSVFADLETGNAISQKRTWPRGREGTVARPGKALYHDRTVPAVGDVDGDGRPDVAFVGHNALFAVNAENEFLDGFPFRYQGDLPEGHLLAKPFVPGDIHSSPLVADVTGDGRPEILSATPAGLLYAVGADGKQVSQSIGASPVQNKSGALRRQNDWPLAVGTVSFEDSLRHPWIRLAAADADGDKKLEVYALSVDRLFAWSLPKAAPNANSWLGECGGSERVCRFDAEALSGETPESSDRILSFRLYPSPLKTPKGNLRIELGAEAKKARVRVLDVTGAVVFDRTWEGLHRGVNRLQNVDFSNLGSDVYSLQLEVKFKDGKSAKKWTRAAVIR
ncbi:MAG: VCBS repeat-containing protein [Fibrobacterales bacterium]|nr:VCBS repeat-containing protein [Fibrobacterales bacterium]